MPKTSPPNKSVHLALLITATILLSYILGALSASALYTWLDGSGNALEDIILRKGPGKLMRRMAMLWAIPFIPFTLRHIQWHGKQDTGWFNPNDTSPRKTALRSLSLGYLLGLLTLGIAAVIMLTTEQRYLRELTQHQITYHAIKALFESLTVGIMEETLMRGILLFTLARVWTPTWAALIISLLTGILHFIHPDPAAFQHAGILPDAWAALKSLPASLSETWAIGLRTINLTLMGLTLSLITWRTRTIWLAAGLHGGWVWIKLFGGFIADVNRDMPYTPLLGQRADNTDGLICTAILITIALIAHIKIPSQTPLTTQKP